MDFEQLLVAAQAAFGERWWNALDLLVAVDGCPRNSPNGMGQWLGKRVGETAGSLRLERKQRGSWSWVYRVVSA